MGNRENFDKEKNPPMTADSIRQFANDYAARSAKIAAILHESAGLMDQAGEAATIKPITSMWPKLLDRMEESAVKQFRAKARAEAEIQKSLARESKKN